jgi:phosphoribosylformimino-5-aminoimidazole carboxamide ribotide isomerase
MRVLPVLDVRQGEVVHGIAGRRSEYRPIRSTLTSSSSPRAIAAAFRAHFALTELYLADLDALAGAPPDVRLYQDLHGDGFRLWVDAGVREAADAAPLIESGIARIIAGLETLAGPTVLRDLCEIHGPERIVFSLDLRAGQPLGGWAANDVESVAAQAIDMGVLSIILLDVARVGTGAGTGTEELLQRLSRSHPHVEWLVGGGVRNGQGLCRLKAIGARGVLVASALHDGTLTHNDVQA